MGKDRFARLCELQFCRQVPSPSSPSADHSTPCLCRSEPENIRKHWLLLVPLNGDIILHIASEVIRCIWIDKRCTIGYKIYDKFLVWISLTLIYWNYLDNETFEVAIQMVNCHILQWYIYIVVLYVTIIFAVMSWEGRLFFLWANQRKPLQLLEQTQPATRLLDARCFE